MSEPRTERQDPERGQGPAALSKEQIELIDAILEPRFEKVVAEMRLIAKEEGEKMRDSMDTAIKELRAEAKELRAEMKDEVRQQSKYFCWVIGILVSIWLAAGVLAVNKWPQATPVAPAAPVAQAAPAIPDEPPGLSQPPDLIEPPDLSQP